MRFLNLTICLLVGIALVASTGVLRAESLPATEIVEQGGVGNYNFSLGWRFTPTEDFYVTHLGVFDVNGDGIQDLDDAGGQQVRLFEWGGGYIADVVAPTGAVGETAGPYGYKAMYVELAEPVKVVTGTEYFVAARVLDYTGNVTSANEEIRPFTRGGGQATAYGSAGDPTMPDVATDFGDTGTFPLGPSGPKNFFGGTFKYQTVPEPTAACLLLIGVLGFAFARNRRG